MPVKLLKLIGWQVITKPVMTSRDQAMLFVSFEDTDSIYETTFFPKAYQVTDIYLLIGGHMLLKAG